MKKLKKFIRSFTLIELIIVIGIISILSVGAYLILSHRMAKGRDARKIADINSLSKGVLIYELENIGYPLPSNAIILTDQYGVEIGKQGSFDKDVVDKLSSIHKTVKDPFTNDYYSYTTYDKFKGFEIGTFIEAMGKVGYNVKNRAYAEFDEVNPYVFVYGRMGFCSPTGKPLFPKPLSLYDGNDNSYLSVKNIGNNGKVVLNLKYLNGSKNLNPLLCPDSISAPISGIISSETDVKIKQASSNKFEVYTGGFDKVINKVCEQNAGLCNSPDIYRIDYNLYILTYTLNNGELRIVEVNNDILVAENPTIPAKKIYIGGGESNIDGKVFGVIGNSGNGFSSYGYSGNGYSGNDYNIYYLGDGGKIMKYTSNNGGTSTQVGHGESQGGTISGITFNEKNDLAVITYSTNTYFDEEKTISDNQSYFINEQGKEFAIPFTCKMPKVYYLSEDLYLVVYLNNDGLLEIKRIKIDNIKGINTVLVTDTLTTTNNEINTEFLQSLQVWDNIMFILHKKNSQYFVSTLSIEGNNYTIIDKKEFYNGIINDLELLYPGGGIVNINYETDTNTIKSYKISQNGEISLIGTTQICKGGTYSFINDVDGIIICPTSPATMQNFTSPTLGLVLEGITIVDYDDEGNDEDIDIGTGTNNVVITGDKINQISNFTNRTKGDSWCAINKDKLIKCWGYDPLEGKVRSPYQIGSLTGALQVVVGVNHSCVLNSNGELYCWGINASNQLNGSINQKLAPHKIGTIPDAKKIAIAHNSTCALMNNGDVRCWGTINYKQVVKGSIVYSSKDIVDLYSTKSDVSNDNAFYNYTFLKTDGSVCSLIQPTKCSNPGKYKVKGPNYYKNYHCYINLEGNVFCQDDNNGPSQINIDNAKDIIYGQNNNQNKGCVLKNDGKVFCRGDNKLGTLGVGMENEKLLTPTQVNGMEGVVGIDVGNSICALLNDGNVKCTGLSYADHVNTSGIELGLNNVKDFFLEIGRTPSSTTICASTYTNNDLFCRGSSIISGNNLTGVINNTTTFFPKVLKGFDNFKKFYMKEGHYCAIMNDDRVKCAGLNQFGQLGLGYASNTLTYNSHYVINLENVKDLHLNDKRTCALTYNGDVKCWGANNRNSIGYGALHTSTYVPYVSTPSLITTGANSFGDSNDGRICVIMNDKRGKCWGANDLGELGNGKRFKIFRPESGTRGSLDIRTSGLFGVTYIINYDGKNYLTGINSIAGNCVYLDNKKVYCMGSTIDLYNGAAKPTYVSRLSNTDKIILSGGKTHGNTCGVLNDKLICIDNGKITESIINTNYHNHNLTNVKTLKNLECGITSSNKIKCFGPYPYMPLDWTQVYIPQKLQDFF